MNKTALLVATIVALLGASLLFFYVRRFEQEASGGEPIKILVAVKPIESTATLTEEMIATREIPQAYVDTRSVRESERARVIGLQMATTLQVGQSLLWSDLSLATEDRRELSSLVQPGLRAVTVRATGDEKNFALIRPGDRVDMIATMQPSSTTPGSSTNAEQKEAVVLLQNALVLAVGLDTGSEAIGRSAGQERSASNYVLTLSLNIPEAQLLALALEKGRLLVALRSPDDVRITEGIADLSSTSLTDQKTRESIQMIRKTGAEGPIKLESTGSP